MKQIQIINGIYGHRDGGRITPVQAGAVVSVPDDEAARLIQMGIAIAVQTQDNDTIDISDGQFHRRKLMQIDKAEMAGSRRISTLTSSGLQKKTEIVDATAESGDPTEEDATETWCGRSGFMSFQRPNIAPGYPIIFLNTKNLPEKRTNPI